MEWDNDKCLQLIELYEMKPEIWQSTHKFYYNKTKKHDAWSEIARDAKITVDVVKAKLNSLLSSFRREKAKQEKSMTTGSGRDEVYESKWFGYRAFAFLLDKNKCRKTLTTADLNLDKDTVKDNDADDVVEVATEEESFQDTEDFASINNSATQEITDTSASEKTKAKHSRNVPPKTKKPKLEATPDPRIDKAFNLLQECAQRDGCDIYGEHIAGKLRSYSKRTQAVVQHLFNNILFNADLGQYDNHIVHADSNASYYNHLQSPSTITSPYPSPYSSIASNNNDWSRTSTPFSQPQSPYPCVSTEQVKNSYNIETTLQNDKSQETSVVNTANLENQPSGSVATYVASFNPNVLTL